MEPPEDGRPFPPAPAPPPPMEFLFNTTIEYMNLTLEEFLNPIVTLDDNRDHDINGFDIDPASVINTPGGKGPKRGKEPLNMDEISNDTEKAMVIIAICGMCIIITLGLVSIFTIKDCGSKWKKQMESQSGRTLFAFFFMALILNVCSICVFADVLWGYGIPKEYAYEHTMISRLFYDLAKWCMSIFFVLRLYFIVNNNTALKVANWKLVVLVTLSTASLCVCLWGTIGVLLSISKPDITRSAIQYSPIVFTDLIVTGYYFQRFVAVVIMQAKIRQKSRSLQNLQINTTGNGNEENTSTPTPTTPYNYGCDGSDGGDHCNGINGIHGNHHQRRHSLSVTVQSVASASDHEDQYDLNDSPVPLSRPSFLIPDSSHLPSPCTPTKIPSSSEITTTCNGTGSGSGEDRSPSRKSSKDLSLPRKSRWSINSNSFSSKIKAWSPRISPRFTMTSNRGSPRTAPRRKLRVTLDQKFVNLITKSTLLNLIGVLSSFVVIGYLVYMAVTGGLINWFMSGALRCLDGMINTACIFLVFGFSTKYYDFGCKYCHRRLRRCCNKLPKMVVRRQKREDIELAANVR